MRRFRTVAAFGLAAIMLVSLAGTAPAKEAKEFKAEFRDPGSPDVVITPCVESGKFSVLPYRITKVSSKSKIKSAEISFSPFTGAATGAPSSSEGNWFATIHPTSVGVSGGELRSGGSWVQVPIEARAPLPGTYDWPSTASDKAKPKPGKSSFTMLPPAPRVHVVEASGFPGNCPDGSTPVPGTDEPTIGTAGAAGAKTKAFTRITIKHRSPFHGKVRSSAPECKIGRRVTLYQKGPKHAVGKDRTGRKGNWRVSGRRAQAGRFFASVKGTTAGNTVCTPARSRTIRVVA